eukprot:4004705-Prorocentrum_lima.AAC.1
MRHQHYVRAVKQVQVGIVPILMSSRSGGCLSAFGRIPCLIALIRISGSGDRFVRQPDEQS